MSNELVAGAQVKAIVPTTYDEVEQLARLVYQSGLAPFGYRSPQAIAVALNHGLEMGIPPMRALNTIAVINGRPCLYGDGLNGLARGSGLCEYIKEWIEGEGDEMTAWCETRRKGEEEPVKYGFSVADAKRAGLWDTRDKVQRTDRKTGEVRTVMNDAPWRKYPKRLLQMRARGFCLRDAYPDVFLGLHTEDEMRELEPEMRDITPAAERMREAKELSEDTTNEGFDLGVMEKTIDAIKEEPAKSPPNKAGSEEAGTESGDSPPASSQDDPELLEYFKRAVARMVMITHPDGNMTAAQMKAALTTELDKASSFLPSKSDGLEVWHNHCQTVANGDKQHDKLMGYVVKTLEVTQDWIEEKGMEGEPADD